MWYHRLVPLGLLASALLAGPVLPAQVAGRPATAEAGRGPLDTAAILASARPEIDAANAAWLPGMQRHDAGVIAAAYADSGLFVAGDGTVTRGRAAVARMYTARFLRLRPIRAGAVVQDGLTVLAPTRIVEWGHGWLELAPERQRLMHPEMVTGPLCCVCPSLSAPSRSCSPNPRARPA